MLTGSNSLEVQAVVVMVVFPMTRCLAELAVASMKSSAETPARGHWNVAAESACPKMARPGAIT